MFTSGCRPSLPVSDGVRRDRHGDPQRRFQRLSGRVLHGGVVLLLRHVGGGVLPGRHASLQLLARVLGKPHGHMRGLCNTPVSQSVTLSRLHAGSSRPVLERVRS